MQFRQRAVALYAHLADAEQRERREEASKHSGPERHPLGRVQTETVSTASSSSSSFIFSKTADMRKRANIAMRQRVISIVVAVV